MLQYFQNCEDCTHVNYPCEYWVTDTESLETSVNLAGFFEDMRLEWNLIRGEGDSQEGKKKKRHWEAEARGNQVFSGGRKHLKGSWVLNNSIFSFFFWLGDFD